MPDPSSLYPQYNPPPNPLTTLTNIANLQGTLNQNKMFQQQFAARQAIGPIYQKSIDPQTGQLDTNKLLSLAAQDPRVAFMAGDLAQQALARQQAQVGIQGTQQDISNKSLANINSFMGSLLANKKATPKDALDGLADLYRRGNVDAMSFANTYKKLDALNGDQSQFQQYLQQQQLQGLPAGERQAEVFGAPGTIDTGGAVVPVVTNRMQGTVTPLTVQGPNGPQIGIQKTLSPGEAAPYSMMTKEQLAQPTEWFDPVKNQKVTGTMAQYLQATGASGGVSGPLAAAPPLGAEASANTAGEGSAAAWNALHADVANSGSRLFSLQKALGALQNTTTGPGTEGRNQILSFLAAAPGINKIIPNGIESVKSYDEANKYLQQYAMGQASGLGAGTDEKLSTALTANASTHISNLAAQDVVKANIGLERYKQAQAQAFDASGKTPQEFSKWQADWNKQVDPRAFIEDQLNKDQLKKMIDSMSSKERDKFAATHKWAKQNGLLN